MRYPRRAARWLVAALCLVPGAALQAADRALLVGIDVYRDSRVPATPGAADDARAVARLLETRFGFPRDGIRLLLDREATAEAIVREFNSWLIEGTEPGDRVFFLYAGHGSQLRDDGADEDDHLDETLAPHDVDPATGGNEIRDDQLDSLVAQLSGRRAVLLFDSCHSGTVTRGLPQAGGAGRPGPRYLPRPEQFQEVWKEDGEFRLRGGPPSYTVAAAPAGGDQRMVDDPGKAGRLSGIVTIAAAGPGQLAYPLEVGADTYRGALSYLFEEIYAGGEGSRNLLGDLRKKSLHTAGGAVTKSASAAVTGGGTEAVESALEGGVDALTVGALQTTIGHGIKRLQETGRLEGSQEPWFEVLSEYPIQQEPLFGQWQQVPAVTMSNPVSPVQVSLRTLDGRSTFKGGENLAFEVAADRGGYLYLLVFSQDRVATCIYPNPDDQGNRIAAGKKVLPASAAYVFPVGEPYGRDVVVAVVAEEPLRLCEKVTYTWEEVFERVDLKAAHEALREQSLRGVGVKSTGKAPVAAPRWQAASLVMETVP